ncbi:MAG: hypothetical protein A2X86_20700 [Bdellovibrionales bacterium GWA2_49_15]|nr:MAG: hypothetical protein A2X86_20700 [Bdellovibrionales bacterium GWA2_49_15]HAZ11264.1 hypothetical protein [Bdellovibrionales bacterium]
MLFFTMSLSNAMAKEQILARVERSDNGGVLRFAAELTDVSDLKGLAFSTSSTRIYVTVADIDGRSKVLYRDSGQDVLSIRAVNFSLYTGGRLELVYLKEYNLLSSNVYKKVVLDLERDGDTWFLSKDGRKVSRLKLNIYRWGISSIDLFY